MPYAGADFSIGDLGSKPLINFDLSNLLQSGETISTCTFALTVQNGTDATPSSRKSGSASISGSVVSQLLDFSSGPSGTVKYLIEATCTTSLDQVIIPWSHLTVQEPQ